LEDSRGDEAPEGRRRRTREKLRELLRAEKLEEREVEVEVSESAGPTLDVGAMGVDGLDFNLGEMLQDMLPRRTRRRMVTVAEARRILLSEETDKLIDMDEVVDEAVGRAENMGIIFLDELDKVAGSRRDQGPDISREGVQRDLLPIVEGSTVQTRYGMVGTEHILFIAAGAFHVARPSDLIPELQGRFPIRVELHSLGEDEFVRILLEPKNALLIQYKALVATEGAELEFTEDGIREIARIAASVNQSLENIGARRLHTVLTTLLEDVMFGLPDGGGPLHFVVDAATVRDRLARIVEDDDLRRYIL
jgi:ATP-dependent HslUV protease ATP-binding subunit HslU